MLKYGLKWAGRKIPIFVRPALKNSVQRRPADPEKSSSVFLRFVVHIPQGPIFQP